MKAQGVLYDKSKIFALDIIKLCNELNKKGEYIITKQLLKSGTSIGANYCEAVCAESPQDFIHKISISLKEANETFFWLDILHDSNNISDTQLEQLQIQLEEIFKMLNSSAITVKQRMKQNDTSSRIIKQKNTESTH